MINLCSTPGYYFYDLKEKVKIEQINLISCNNNIKTNKKSYSLSQILKNICDVFSLLFRKFLKNSIYLEKELYLSKVLKNFITLQYPIKIILIPITISKKL